jgi:hypothetical protein
VREGAHQVRRTRGEQLFRDVVQQRRGECLDARGESLDLAPGEGHGDEPAQPCVGRRVRGEDVVVQAGGGLGLQLVEIGRVVWTALDQPRVGERASA